MWGPPLEYLDLDWEVISNGLCMKAHFGQLKNNQLSVWGCIGQSIITKSKYDTMQ